MNANLPLADDATVVQRLLDHIDRGTTDLGDETWREPVAHYRAPERFEAERAALRGVPLACCPSAALPQAGSWMSRGVAGTPLLLVRGDDGRVRAFRNACRHRGTELASGSGCQRAFACRYHGWTYGLDGSLRHVPHEHGFPGLDKRERGLVPVTCTETQGVVFASVDPPEADAEASLAALPALVPDGFRLIGSRETEQAVNWKLVVEGFLEGYHIKTTHPKTFYPLQYDNVNVVERFGRHNRIAFPYRSIERQRGLAPEERSADGTLTYVYHLFPHALVATFPGRRVLAILEPLAVDRTRQLAFTFTDRPEGDGDSEAFLERGLDLVDAGSAEDAEMACAIQRGLASDANATFEYGRFEAAIVHFHRRLRELLGEAA
jgi:phenylpropionate dioxygenase-like ring-hydroxylating dioxygenase large terminal subunit